MEKLELTCIGCPLGCSVKVTLENNIIISVEGNTCKRGEIYARKEITAPTRIVTSTVRVTGSDISMVSCKTASDIPKEKIFDVIDALKDISVAAPVRIGDVLVKNVSGTGVDIIATKNANTIYM